jgi:hypothetical protein
MQLYFKKKGIISNLYIYIICIFKINLKFTNCLTKNLNETVALPQKRNLNEKRERRSET